MLDVSKSYLPGARDRAKHMRLDIARILKRFHFCERALIISQAGWIAGIAPMEVKLNLSRILWEDALTGDELRNRVFELRYPSRFLEIGDDAPVVGLFQESLHAPNAAAYILALARVYKPSQLSAYHAYLNIADVIADGPSVRFITSAVRDKEHQVELLERFAREMLSSAGDADKDAAYAWADALHRCLDEVGALGIDAPKPLTRSLTESLRKPFQFAEVPARDPQFSKVRYYWPNVVDPNFSYGEGVLLQLRSAVSHLNEVWAVETGGAILYFFADKLDWNFIVDAARWTYDEARHTQMGYERLLGWGFKPEEMPLGTYIFDSARGEPPIVRLGMLHYFETKNIGKKNDRAAAFESYHDDVSQHDMEFDWADETMHAHYGSKWLKVLQDKYPADIPDRDALHDRCDALVEKAVAEVTESDKQQIHDVAQAMIDKANRLAQVVE
jgi:uncharacterized ferritin-like protein (DUF455 family)